MGRQQSRHRGRHLRQAAEAVYDHGKLFDSDSIGVLNSIDPMRFTDDDGTAYLIWGSFKGVYGILL